jgi:predicted nucleic acid-binding protein
LSAGLDTHVPLVFVDTNVFYPLRLADLILSSVDDGLFELCASDHLLAEMERVLIDHKRLSADKAKIFREAVEANALRVVRAGQYELLTERLAGPDTDDLHHLAAAITGGADFIITENTVDFLTAHVPDEVTPPAIVTPDEFFAQLLHAGFEDDILGIVQRISMKLKNPPRSPSEILDGLEQIGLSKTVTHLRDHILPTELNQ